uniref:Ycf13 n=1 Tax=Strombomonas acuminata TaxID=201859 RepID=I6NJX5_9EUGL|nr:ycf13 [Strombomonas acuminata]
MVYFNGDTFFQWKLLSWENSYKNLFRLQRRLSKSILVSDKAKALLFQKLILNSNSARLLAIRQVTQIGLAKSISGVDGKTSLTFTERFELNECLKYNMNNWIPQSFKKVSLIRKNGSIQSFNISTISDRAWQIVVRYSIEPSYEAIFSFRNYGFRFGRSIHDSQKDILLALSPEAYGYQKRVLKFNLVNSLSVFNFDFLLKKVLAPRGIKLGIFRLLKLGFKPFFSIDFEDIFSFNALIGNVILHGIENLFTSFRFGHEVLVLLKPLDREDFIVKKFRFFLSLRGSNLDISCISLFSIYAGFNFLDWAFKVDKNFRSISFPSSENYQIFLKRVKLIVNNSNYGASIKGSKLLPIIKDWKTYHRYCNVTESPFSLFYMKKRAFKIFSNEAKQDVYSTKRLIDKCFNLKLDFSNTELVKPSPYHTHNVFWTNYKSNRVNNLNYDCLFYKKIIYVYIAE